MIALFATEKLKKLAPLYQQFITEKIFPLEKSFLSQPFLSLEKGAIHTLRQEAKAAGLWAPHLPESEGGQGLGMIEFAQISELMGQTPLGHIVFNCQAPDIGNMELLHGYASQSIKDQYLKPLEQGAIRSCFSMTEPELAGSNPVMMNTTATKEGNHYVINGHKWFTSSADGAAFAIVMAVTNPEAKSPYQKASMIIVPCDNPGFNFVRNISVMGEAGEGYLSHAEIRYENCKVPITNIIHEEGSGFMLAQQRLGPGRIHHCMRWIGICERALDLMCRRAVTRELSPGRPLAYQQTIQNWIAESRVSINAARYMVLHAAHKIDTEGSKAARQEISSIKFYVANVMQQVLDHAVQSHGALGITEDTLLSWWYRHERGARIYDGPDEVHKSALARSVLKPYGIDIKDSF